MTPKKPIEQTIKTLMIECIDKMPMRKVEQLKLEIVKEFSDEYIQMPNGVSSSSRQTIALNAAGELAEPRYRKDKTFHWYVARTRRGTIRGIIEFHMQSDNRAAVDYIATSGKTRGTGVRLMLEAAKYAMEKEVMLRLSSTTYGQKFYEKLGMKDGDSGYEFTAEEVANFTGTGNAS